MSTFALHPTQTNLGMLILFHPMLLSLLSNYNEVCNILKSTRKI